MTKQKKPKKRKKSDYDFNNPFEANLYTESQEDKQNRESWGDNW